MREEKEIRGFLKDLEKTKAHLETCGCLHCLLLIQPMNVRIEQIRWCLGDDIEEMNELTEAMAKYVHERAL